MLWSLIKILRASLVQIYTEMAEKYANQRCAVPLLHYDDLFPIYGLLRVAGVDRLTLSIDRVVGAFQIEDQPRRCIQNRLKSTH